MKTFSCLVIVCLASIQAHAQKLRTCIPIYELENPTEKRIKKYVCNCRYLDYSENKTIQEEGYYKDCLEEGKWITYSDSGRVWMIINYKAGQRHGEFISYFANGQIAIKCNWDNGKYHGAYYKYDYDGNLCEENEFDHSRLVKSNKIKDWEMDGVQSYIYETDTLNNLIPGVYVWEKGQRIRLRDFTQNETDTGVVDFDLTREVLDEYYKNKK